MSHDHSPEKLQAGIYRETRDVNRPIDRLMHWVLDRNNLLAAWHRVAGNTGAGTPGIDGVTCDDVARGLSRWLARLADDLLHGNYAPSPPRWVQVPKHGGSSSLRRLGILTIRDRVVHAALKQVLEPVLEPAFRPTSFGFRPGRSVPAALAETTQRLSHRRDEAPAYRYAVHLDIANCFDTIDQQRLIEVLNRHVCDGDLLALVRRLLEGGGTTVRRWWWSRTRGIVQGSSLSPLLCNLYLDPIDGSLEWLAASTRDAVCGLRYADDILVLARDWPVACRAVFAVRDGARRLGLRLRNPWRRPVRVDRGAGWLGVVIRPRRQAWSDRVTYGYDIPDDKVQKLFQTLTEMTAPPSERVQADAINLGRWIVSINDQLRQWRQAYVFADNATPVFRAVDDHARRRVRQLIVHVTGARDRKLFDTYSVRLPRGFWTWQADGVRLVTLSALAPRNPYRLVRKPTWQRLAECPFQEASVR